MADRFGSAGDVINPGDNVKFLDLVYDTWTEGERQKLDALAGLMDGPASLSADALERIGEYSMRDPGDEDDQERENPRLGEFRERFGHTVINWPSWWPQGPS